jgi:hypothetical protein
VSSKPGAAKPFEDLGIAADITAHHGEAFVATFIAPRKERSTVDVSQFSRTAISAHDAAGPNGVEE